MIGYLAMVLLYVGLFCPIGKFSVFQILSIIQYAYLSVLQFKKFPITFNGFNSLSLSNGVNINSGDIQNILQENLFTCLGIYSNSFLQNFNVTFVLVFFLPFVIGLISILVVHFASNKSSTKTVNSQLAIF